MWEIDSEKTKDHWLELKDPEGWYSAVVKWDGCIHFNRYYNEPMDSEYHKTTDQANVDYIHICDVDDMIARLKALKETALEYFGEYWGE